MPQLSPNESFPVVRVLKDHTDVGTNYVQAVIRDATTDVVLATLNLTDLGNRRFRYVWKVPYDNVFQIGRYIVITTTVYTDSGYTLKSDNYLDEADTYLIQERWSANKIFAAGGHAIDYKELRKIIVEELQKIEQPEIPEPQVIDTESIVSRLMSHVTMHAQGIQADVAKIPAPPKTDLAPVLASIERIIGALAALPQKHADLAPILNEMRSLGNALRQKHDENTADIKKAIKENKQEVLVRHSLDIAQTPAEIQLGKKNVYLEGLKRKHGITS